MGLSNSKPIEISSLSWFVQTTGRALRPVSVAKVTHGPEDPRGRGRCLIFPIRETEQSDPEAVEFLHLDIFTWGPRLLLSSKEWREMKENWLNEVPDRAQCTVRIPLDDKTTFLDAKKMIVDLVARKVGGF